MAGFDHAEPCARVRLVANAREMVDVRRGQYAVADHHRRKGECLAHAVHEQLGGVRLLGREDAHRHIGIHRHKVVLRAV